MMQPLDTMSLEKKCRWVRRESLRLHGKLPETRIASSLSAVEILVAMYYSGILRYDTADPRWADRDRFIVSKGHGSIALYPIFSDLGFFPKEMLEKIGSPHSFLGGIPDCIIPGYETTNGSLGHGLGVAVGISLALHMKNKCDINVPVLVGDGELAEGSVWEGVMLAAQHHCDNITLIVDNNKISMLGYMKDILDMGNIDDRLRAFGFDCIRIDGHDIDAVTRSLASALGKREGKPKAIIADTIKGKGVPSLECDPLCHIKNVSPEEIERYCAENAL